jgi:hypothetical protein
MAPRPALGRGLDQLLEPGPAPAQQDQGSPDTARRLRQLLGVGAKDLLRTDDIARDYRFPSADAVRKFLRRHEVPYLTRGRIVLVDRRDFEASMSKTRKARLQKAS